MTDDELKRRAEKVKMIILDVDGVMTDGRVYINSEGVESKGFDIRDGFGIIMAGRAGIEFAIITGLMSPIVEHRARQVGIEEIHQGFVDKVDVMNDILKRHNLDSGEAAYMGDDLFDLPVLRKVGLAAAPSDAHPDVLTEVNWVSSRSGGRGAVRELIDFILRARGELESARQEFVRP